MSDQAPFILPAADEDLVRAASGRVLRTPGFRRLLGAQFVSSLGDWTGLFAGFTVVQERVADDMRGRIFAALYTIVRLCLLLSLTIGPFVSSGLGSLSNAATNGPVKLGTFHLNLPGPRLALWFGELITIASGFAARRRMRMPRRIDASAYPS